VIIEREHGYRHFHLLYNNRGAKGETEVRWVLSMMMAFKDRTLVSG
jgi:hypothetical protein